jgi:endonuclease YncB( thermonuclease family)
MRLGLLFVLVLLSDLATAHLRPRGRVQDGDTLTVLVNKRQVKVRLDAIHAPEAT